MDKLLIKGLRVLAHHGVFESEREEGQIFVLDITLHLNLLKACASDDLAYSINYAEAAALACRAMADRTYHLIERAAQAVADTLLNRYESLMAVDVTVSKPRAPIPLDFETVAVQIHRKRGGADA